MKLYIDLQKAVGQIPSTAQEGKRSSQRSREYLTSFDTDYQGANAGYVAPDDPDVGKDWHGDAGGGTTVSSLVDDKDKANAEAEAEAKLIPKEKDEEEQPPQPAPGGEDMGKALAILDGLKKSLSEQFARPNEHERAFLIEKGFSPDKVDLGLVKITGPLRHEFHMWIYKSLTRSIADLTGSVS